MLVEFDVEDCMEEDAAFSGISFLLLRQQCYNMTHGAWCSLYHFA